MSKYQLFSQTVEYSAAEERFFDFYHKSIDAANQATSEFAKWYDECGDIYTVLKGYKKIASSLVIKYANQPLFDTLTALEIYDISEDRYDNNCFILDDIRSAFDEIAEQYDDIIAEQEAAEEYREERKAYRGRVEGGGFGVGGAIKGMAMAGAMNAVSGMGHSIVNAIGNANSAATAASNKKALYNARNTYITLARGIHYDIISCYFAHLEFINNLITDYYVDPTDIERAEALFESAKKVESKRESLLFESFSKFPFNEKLLIYIFTNYRLERKNTWNIANRFFIDLSDNLEAAFWCDYEKSDKSSEAAAQQAKNDILSQMRDYGITESKTIDQFERDGVERILSQYDFFDCANKSEILKAANAYDAKAENKATIIRKLGIWELAEQYGIIFSLGEKEAIVSTYYNQSVDTEEQILLIKTRLLTVMKELGLESSETFDKFEKHCIGMLCTNYATADEKTCRAMIKDINEYDALQKNKESFILNINKRIEEIWATEERETLGTLYMNLNIYNVDEIQEAISYIEKNGRTQEAKKFASALRNCNNKNIKNAFRYKSSISKIALGLSILLILIAVLSFVGFVPTIFLGLIGFVYVLYYLNIRKSWKTLTLDGTVIHGAFSEARKSQFSNTQKQVKQTYINWYFIFMGIFFLLFCFSMLLFLILVLLAFI